MFLFNLTYTKPLTEIEALLPEHIRFLDECYANGWFLCSGRKNPRTGGIILCTCERFENAEFIRNQDPFYQKGAARYEIIEFLPTKASPEFRTLLEKRA